MKPAVWFSLIKAENDRFQYNRTNSRSQRQEIGPDSTNETDACIAKTVAVY